VSLSAKIATEKELWEGQSLTYDISPVVRNRI
jgi:hypothetical protein